MKNKHADDTLAGYFSPNVVNRDNQYLHAVGPIGHVDEVNGPGATEVPDFTPTRHEVLQLGERQ